jgi:hypothetical protein
MNTKTLGALVTLNLALLVALLVAVLTPPPAQAQAARGRGEYVMISGDVAGRSGQQVVYILELKNQHIAAVFYNSADNTLTLVDTHSLAKDLEMFVPRR